MKELQQIFDHFGIEAQKMKLIEEMAELTAELAKPNKDELKIMAEIADVSVVLEQIIDYYGREAIDNIRQGKIERTLERINSGYYEEKKQMSNLKPNTNELAQVVVNKLNNTCQICHSILEDGEKYVCQVCRVNLMQDHIANVSKTIRSQKDQDLIETLKSIANDIEKDNIVEPECIRWAAKRLEELT